MVWKIECTCKEHFETKINSLNDFEEIKLFFETEIEKGIYIDIPVEKAYYTGYSKLQDKYIKSYASKWYKCTLCKCLWEFKYPDFPAKGFVRKFEDGIYYPI